MIANVSTGGTITGGWGEVPRNSQDVGGYRGPFGNLRPGRNVNDGSLQLTNSSSRYSSIVGSVYGRPESENAAAGMNQSHGFTAIGAPAMQTDSVAGNSSFPLLLIGAILYWSFYNGIR